MNYPLASFLIQIKNAYMARRKALSFPHSRLVFSVGKILKKEGYIKDIREKKEGTKKAVYVELLYKSGEPVMKDVDIISKPSLRQYAGKDEIKKRNNRFDISILSTNKGVMSQRDAIKQNIGGELLCRIS